MATHKKSRGPGKNLAEHLLNIVTNGLDRKSIRTCGEWACKYRVMPPGDFSGPWSFKYHPWLEGMHNCTADFIVGQKSAQAGFTEWLLNTVFFEIDINQSNVLYVLPTKNPGASTFSASRFNPALEASAHLRSMFSMVDNIGHKRAGSANLHIVGSRSRSALKEKPCNIMAFDEVAEMVQANIPLAFERGSGKLKPRILMVSTPTIPGRDINTYYNQTTQNHFFFKCPSCSRMTELVYPQCLVIIGEDPDDPRVHESYLICKECKAVLPHATKHEYMARGRNEWVPAYANKNGEGFHTNQLYSPTISPGKFAIAALRARLNPFAEQELYNSKLGLTHTTAGASVTDADINACIEKGNFMMADVPDLSDKPLTMGVDIGQPLCHYVIREWTIPSKFKNPADPGPECTSRTIRMGHVRHFGEISELIEKHRINHTVVDANPERRSAYQLCMKHFGRVHMCYYVRGIQSRQLYAKKERDTEVMSDEPSVCVDRTSWLDATFSRYKLRTILLPGDTTQEYKDHIKAPVRKYEKGANDELISTYEMADDAHDHFAHAENYAEIAFPFVLGQGTVKRVKKKVF